MTSSAQQFRKSELVASSPLLLAMTSQKGLPFRRAELAAVNVGFSGERIARFHDARGLVVGQRCEASRPAFTFDRQALRHRCAFRQHTVEIYIVPARRKI